MTDKHTRVFSGRLRAMTGRIDSFFLPLEAVFLTTGGRLQELHRTVSRLSDNVEMAGALFSSSDMHEIMTEMAGVARHIDTLRTQRGGLATTLGEMIADTDRILRSLATLEGIMAQILVLAVNAKIEASQLTSTGTNFSVFTRDITRLAKSGEQTIAAVRRELGGLRTAAAKARTLQHEFEAKELPELDAVAERLAVSVAGLHDSRNRAERGSRDVPGKLNALFNHIGRLVSDLQVYDTARQRLEHVEQALTLAADMIEAENASDMDSRQQLVFVNGIADLQSLQLAHAGDHYHEVINDVGRNLSAMAKEVPTVAALCRQAFGGDEGSSLLDINRNLIKASHVFSNFISVRQQAASSLDQVAQATTRAGELMRSLNSVNGDMRLMGLNAAIKCGNMGTIGRALDVIARELQGYATLTREHVQAVAGHLAKISTSAASIVSTDNSEAGAIDAESLKGEIDQVGFRLELTGNGLSQIMAAITNLTDQIEAESRTAEGGFSGKADCQRPMADGVRELKSLAADSNPGLSGAELEAARREVLSFTESHYTMASERSIHGVAIDGHKAVELLTGTDSHESDGGEPDISALLF
ncbi:MAG: hypothetical protein WCF85_04290 [Rhodospirillaceae bacterium]